MATLKPSVTQPHLHSSFVYMRRVYRLHKHKNRSFFGLCERICELVRFKWQIELGYSTRSAYRPHEVDSRIIHHQFCLAQLHPLMAF